MHRSGNPRFDRAVSTGGTRGPRVDHPSSEGVVLISPLIETNRKAGSHRYALAGAPSLLLPAPPPLCARRGARGAARARGARGGGRPSPRPAAPPFLRPP